MDVTLDRFEYKYPIHRARIPHLQRLLLPHLEPDPHAARCRNHTYTVRSIYFDTREMRYYWDKVNGLKTRKKLRVRAYGNLPDDSPLFLEIKHKINRRIFKERARIPLGLLERQTHPFSDSTDLGAWRYRDRRLFRKIQSIQNRYPIRPALLVAYERQAYYDRNDSGVRVTFDFNIRTRLFPSPRSLYTENNMVHLFPDHLVLECKFYGLMPGWLRRALQRLGLTKRSVSKYCDGFDACSSQLSAPWRFAAS